MIVLDASAAVELVLRTPAAPAIDVWVFASGRSIHAPHVLDVEVAQAIRRIVDRGLLDAARGAGALANLSDLPIKRYGHRPLLKRMWDLRNNLSAYDAAYVALAEAIGATLITGDARLARSVGHAADIQLIASVS